MKRVVVLGLLLFSLFALNVTLPSATPNAEAYECKPAGTWYCQQNSQCAGFCGSDPYAHAYCQFGCCRCAASA